MYAGETFFKSEKMYKIAYLIKLCKYFVNWKSSKKKIGSGKKFQNWRRIEKVCGKFSKLENLKKILGYEFFHVGKVVEKIWDFKKFSTLDK